MNKDLYFKKLSLILILTTFLSVILISVKLQLAKPKDSEILSIFIMCQNVNEDFFKENIKQETIKQIDLYPIKDDDSDFELYFQTSGLNTCDILIIDSNLLNKSSKESIVNTFYDIDDSLFFHYPITFFDIDDNHYGILANDLFNKVISFNNFDTDYYLVFNKSKNKAKDINLLIKIVYEYIKAL